MKIYLFIIGLAVAYYIYMLIKNRKKNQSYQDIYDDILHSKKYKVKGQYSR